MSEEEIKQEIEQIGYKEFYRYYKEKDILLNKQKEVLDKIKEYRKWLDKNTVIYCGGECVKLNGTYWEAEGIKIILDKILEEIE